LTNKINMDAFDNQYYAAGIKKRNLTRIPSRVSNERLSIPPIDEITGESVMPSDYPSDYPLVPLIPATRQDVTPNGSPDHSQEFLRRHIGRQMRVEFLVGANGALIDKTGVLVQVGESYIVLRPADTDDLLMCDLYSIKFATVYR